MRVPSVVKRREVPSVVKRRAEYAAAFPDKAKRGTWGDDKPFDPATDPMRDQWATAWWDEPGGAAPDESGLFPMDLDEYGMCHCKYCEDH